jgi:hypothetical protein
MTALSAINLEIPLPESDGLITEEIEDPLSPAELAAHTRVLCQLISRAKRRADRALLRSLRLELLAARWAFVKVTRTLCDSAL